MPKVNNGPDWNILVTSLDYDKDTGIFRWKIDCGGRKGNRIKAGSIAGSLNGEGYRDIGINKRVYRAHRLAWLYVTKVWPNCVVDHKNGIVNDNRFDNLRLATDRQSSENRTHKNKYGLKGVSTKRNLFRARIFHNGKSVHIGYYATKEEAAAAYLNKSLELQKEFSVAWRT